MGKYCVGRVPSVELPELARAELRRRNKSQHKIFPKSYNNLLIVYFDIGYLKFVVLFVLPFRKLTLHLDCLDKLTIYRAIILLFDGC